VEHVQEAVDDDTEPLLAAVRRLSTRLTEGPIDQGVDWS
jgi:hypothetical protein